MAERCIPTNLLFAKVSNYLAGQDPTDPTYLSLCGESMSGFSATTTDFADELTRVQKSWGSGISIVTTTVTDDTFQIAHTSWEPGADTIYGAGLFTGAADATLQVFHEWATSVTFESGDTVDQTIKIQSKLGT